MLHRIKQSLRNIVYPGLDLHVRNRASLSRYWKIGSRDVLDAGSGNGYFSWLAYRSGANVIALNFEDDQVDKAQEFLVSFRKANPERLHFEQYNLYDLTEDNRRFDEIICYEVLEHIKNDQQVLKAFYKVLRPGGVLHLCCPNRLHPRHQAEVLDLEETGGHVRPGYTEDDYREILEPIGFEIQRVVGIGSKQLYIADEVLRTIRNRFGDIVALPLLPVALPIVWLEKPNPKVPFSLYVTAVKS